MANPNMAAGVALVVVAAIWLLLYNFKLLNLQDEQNEQAGAQKEIQNAPLKAQKVLLDELLYTQSALLKAQNEQAGAQKQIQSALLRSQKDLLDELLYAQSALLKAQRDELLNVQKVERGKKAETGSRLLPKRPKCSVR